MQPDHGQGEPAALRHQGQRMLASGDWVVGRLHGMAERIALQAWPDGELQLDFTAVRHMDTGGALLLHRMLQRLDKLGRQVVLDGLSHETEQLLALVRDTDSRLPASSPAARPNPLEALGRHSLTSLHNAGGMLAFVGETAVAWLRMMLDPRRIRWSAIVHELGEAGHKALAIVGLLAFLLGIVITYQGGVQLRQYGASIFVADLVGLSMLRELAPIITAIIVAGRTGSAYTAQIGTMQVTEEVDALKVMGVPPQELLVLPKLLALLIALPLLTVYADVMGVLGGMVMASIQLDIAYSTFLERLEVALTLKSYLVGVGKAPVFAAVIALIGCYQGFQVHGSAESVGRRTTVSVVQSILAVIVIDAAFSVAFSALDI